jgi:muconolactone D-isomerase
MLFHVRMNVNLPIETDPEVAARLKEAEKLRFQELQRSGKWRHIWRVAGQYANISIFDVDSPSELHELLLSLPLFPFMRIEVITICRHPSSLHTDDR